MDKGSHIGGKREPHLSEGREARKEVVSAAASRARRREAALPGGAQHKGTG